MFKRKPKTNALLLEKDRILEIMSHYEPDTEEYKACLERVIAIDSSIIANKRSVSPDAILAAGVSIFSIVLILGYEKANVITTKAMQFIKKGRV